MDLAAIDNMRTAMTMCAVVSGHIASDEAVSASIGSATDILTARLISEIQQIRGAKIESAEVKKISIEISEALANASMSLFHKYIPNAKTVYISPDPSAAGKSQDAKA